MSIYIPLNSNLYNIIWWYNHLLECYVTLQADLFLAPQLYQAVKRFNLDMVVFVAQVHETFTSVYDYVLNFSLFLCLMRACTHTHTYMSTLSLSLSPLFSMFLLVYSLQMRNNKKIRKSGKFHLWIKIEGFDLTWHSNSCFVVICKFHWGFIFFCSMFNS